MVFVAPVLENVGVGIRAEWLYEAARVNQSMLCEVACPDTLGLSRILRLADAIPLPQTELEQLIYLGLLSQVMLGSVDGPLPLLPRARDLVGRALELWRKPPVLPPRAERAAAIITARATETLYVTWVAQEVGCGVTLLRRDFKRRFGVSMKTYHICARVQVGLHLIAAGCGNNTDIAHAAGYESEKNFYIAVRRFTGLTPARLRLLSPSDLEALAASIVPVGSLPQMAITSRVRG